MMLIREFAHDMNVKRKVNRAVRMRNRKPNHRQSVALNWMVGVWMSVMGVTVLGGITALVGLAFGFSPWYLLVIVIGVPLLVLGYQFLSWYESKHVNGENLYEELDKKLQEG